MASAKKKAATYPKGVKGAAARNDYLAARTAGKFDKKATTKKSAKKK